ncbi:MAG: hypothetical protein JW837_12610 [Sedimentisphaerales bacterium]|nr:hypothetical protein [Sedimentisphaerales bacterium]
MVKKSLTIFILLLALKLNVHGEILYSNNFDTPGSLNGLVVSNGSGGNVSIEGGQLKLVGGLATYHGAYVSIPVSLFSEAYTGKLSDITQTISWSFNLSNINGSLNNGFEIHLINDNSNPYNNDQYSYFIRGGILVGNRMEFWRGTHTYSPYGNDSEVLIDIPSENGLAPLPEKGSFRIDYTPSTSKWELYSKYGSSYTDPRQANNLLGYAYDNIYANDYMPYFTLEGLNGGAVYIDNLTIEYIPEPAMFGLMVMGWIGLARKRSNNLKFKSSKLKAGSNTGKWRFSVKVCRRNVTSF